MPAIEIVEALKIYIAIRKANLGGMISIQSKRLEIWDVARADKRINLDWPALRNIVDCSSAPKRTTHE